MPAVFTQMRRDAVRTGGLANLRRFDRIRLAVRQPAIPRFADRGHMVSVDAELEHFLFDQSAAHVCQMRRASANEISFGLHRAAVTCFLCAVPKLRAFIKYWLPVVVWFCLI